MSILQNSIRSTHVNHHLKISIERNGFYEPRPIIDLSLYYQLVQSFTTPKTVERERRSASVAIAASVPVIFRAIPFLLGKLRSFGSLSSGESCGGRIFHFSSCVLTTSTIFAVWTLNIWANSSAAAPENSFYFSITCRAISNIKFWPWFRYLSLTCLSYSALVDMISWKVSTSEIADGLVIAFGKNA